MPTPAIRKRFARRVRKLREATGLTQEKFAAEAGLDRAYYGRIERGLGNVTLDTIETIARGLGVEPWELLWFAGAKKRP